MIAHRSVVLVGGALEDRTAWDALVPLLTEHAAVLTPDRPGRGGNDRPDTGPEGELDELREVLGRVGDVVLVGHSSGALLALRAAAADTTGRVVGDVAYEPPPAPPVPGVAARLRALVAADDRPEAVRRFLTDAVGLPEDAAQRSVDPAAVAGAHTLAVDAEIAAAGLPGDLAARITVPVTLLVGSQSPPSMVASVRSIAVALPLATVRDLPGHGHDAHRTEPEPVAEAVLDLL